jgi:hypothetical protein
MKKLTFLFEFYESVHNESYARFEEYPAETLPRAENNLISDYPEARIINTYVSTRDVEIPA